MYHNFTVMELIGLQCWFHGLKAQMLGIIHSWNWDLSHRSFFVLAFCRETLSLSFFPTWWRKRKGRKKKERKIRSYAAISMKAEALTRVPLLWTVWLENPHLPCAGVHIAILHDSSPPTQSLLRFEPGFKLDNHAKIHDKIWKKNNHYTILFGINHSI